MIKLGHGARVFLPLTDDPDKGGGPVRRSPFALVPAHYSQQVRKSPHAVVFSPASGYDPPDYSRLAFLPDGRLQPRSEFPAVTSFAGAGPDKRLLGAALLIGGLGAVVVAGAVAAIASR